MTARTALAAVALLAPALVAAAQPAPDDILKASRTVIAQARYATLVTVDDAGQPQARIVDPFPPEDDFTIWVGTSALTRKVGQVERNPRVSLLYFDASRQAYVSIAATAAIVRDPAEKARHWKAAWEGFYKGGSSSEQYVLVRIVPARIEVVAAHLGMTSDPATWRPVGVDLSKPRPR